jgi:hypothetical protein
LFRDIAPADPRELFLRLEELMNIELRSSAKKSLQYVFKRRTKIDNPLSIEDIKERRVRVKHLPIISYSEGFSQSLSLTVFYFKT